MKKITFWLYSILICSLSFAQTTVTIGTGTTSAAGTNGTPIYRSSSTSTFHFSQSVQLLTASDLAAVGITAGSTITKIAYYKNDANVLSGTNTATLNLYMKNSSATSLVTTQNFATWISGATNVYNNTALNNASFPAAAGWVEFTFSTPFIYTGGAIETAINWQLTPTASPYSSGSFSWMYTTVTGAQAVGTSNSAVITGNLSSSQTRIYNTQLTYTNSPCSGTPAPGNTIASTSTPCFGSSVVLSLQNPTIGTGVTYQWYLNGLPISGANSATYTVPSVTASDTYYCEVTCSGNTTASTSLLVSPSILTAPVTEPFATFLPSCWTNMFGGDLTTGPTASTGSGWVVDGFANVGTTGAIRNEIFTTGANDWVVSPVINIPASGYELKFDAAATQWASTTSPTTPWESDDYIEVLVATGGSTTNWTPLFTYNDTNQPSNTGSPNIIDLDAYAGQNVRFAFHAVEGATNGAADIDFSIDNFEIRLSPACPDQTGLVLGNVTAYTVDASWTDLSGSGAIAYEYAVTTSATPPASGTVITNAFVQATGLNAQTVYYFHVRSNCAGSTYGNWITGTFTTACAPVTTFPVLEPFATFLPSACWIKGDNGDLTAGPATFGNNSWKADGFANVGTTGSIAYNHYTTGANDWIISPEYTIPTSGYELKFDAALTQWGATTAPTTAWDAGDVVEVLVANGITNWSVIYTFDNANTPATSGSPYVFDLDAYAGQTVRFAYRVVSGATDGSDDTDFFVDNFQIRLSPTCPDQTGLVIGAITATTVDASWDDLSGSGAVGYEYAVTTSATPPASGTSIATTFVQATGLSPQTVYYIHVRPLCSGSVYGNWITSTFTTACAAITTLPWTEGFEGLTTVGANNFPSCWFKQNGGWESRNSNDTYSTSNTGTKFIRNPWSATNEFIWTPGFDLVAGTSYDFSSFIQGDNGTTWVVDYFVNSAQNSTGATQIGTTYNVPGTGTTYAAQAYNKVTATFVPATSGTYYFAVRVNESTGNPWYVSFDDFELKLTPATPPSCATGLTATPDATCGNFASTLSWTAEPLATGYYVTIGTTSGGSDIANAVPVSVTSYSFSGLNNTQYFWKVVPYNGAGSATGCTEQSFTTAVNGCYCVSVPSSLDNSGITNVVLGATPYTITPVTYVNNTATPEIIAPGATANLQLTFSTGYTYDINVWIDFNNDFDFDDAGELVKTGIACTNVQPNTVDASFTMPLTAPSGPHRMRIGTADSGQVPPAPCYNGSYGVTLDFTVDTSLATSSFDLSNFVAYPNPVKDVLNLSYSTAITNVKVTNLLGQQVMTKNVNDTNVQVNMSDLSAGAYIVTISSGDMIHTIKVVKQ